MMSRWGGISLQERFDDKWIPEPNSGCWLWTAGGCHLGYGRILAKGRVCQAHRVGYELYKEPIPQGLCVLHSCDTPSCVNPDHMFLGTRADNALDRDMKGRNVVRFGERSGRAKITERQVREIRVASGTSQQIGESHNLSAAQANAIKNRKSWKHVK